MSLGSEEVRVRRLLVASVLMASAVRADPVTPEASVWTSGKLVEAANLVRPAFSTRLAVVPDLERQRLAEPAAPGLKADNDIELGTKTEVTPVADAHFRVHMAQDAYPNWFILRVTNVPPGGKIVRFDLDNGNVQKLSTANPVYTPLRDLADPETYMPADGTDRRTAKASGGAVYPTAAGLAWKFIPDVWRSGTGDLTFVHRFDRDTIVALRVPYGLGYHAALVKSFDGLPTVTVHAVGDQANVIEVGSADEAKRKSNPCVVVYTREDGCQQDASWLIEGAAQFLIGDTPDAVAVRDKCTFLLIPIISPESAKNSTWANDAMQFDSGGQINRGLTSAYRTFFTGLSGEGRKIAAVFDLFTPESAEFRTMSFDRVNGNTGDDAAFYSKLKAACDNAGIYTCVPPVGTKTVTFSYRLVGELHRTFGAQQFSAFVNSQDRERHLSLDELRQFGGLFAEVAADYFATPPAAVEAAHAPNDGHHP